jgi:transcriptional regulator with XRE-family HTH domain
MASECKYAKLGATIAAGRRAKGIALQSDLADLIGSSQQSVSRWEAGTSRPRPAQLQLLTDKLGLDERLLWAQAEYGAPGEALPAAATVSFDQSWPLDALSPESFERFVDHFLRARYPEADVRRAGKSGHTQDGFFRRNAEASCSQSGCQSGHCRRLAAASRLGALG